MLKKSSIAVGLMCAAVVTFAAAVPSASADTTPGANVVLVGRGTLSAQGTGVAAVRGLMDYHASANRGILMVKDMRGDAFIDVDVHNYDSRARWDGWTIFFGFHGPAHITGTDVGVVLVGGGLDVNVTGRGWAFLKGDGTYSVNGGTPQPWSADGGFAPLAPAPTPTATATPTS
ncbi:MAG TPA: hypothetical protein VEZ14_09280 [Dehalococcoidia bacterium]|nr:hypothetical protein [Dehalococcoidia bacterium]